MGVNVKKGKIGKNFCVENLFQFKLIGGIHELS